MRDARNGFESNGKGRRRANSGMPGVAVLALRFSRERPRSQAKRDARNEGKEAKRDAKKGNRSKNTAYLADFDNKVRKCGVEKETIPVRGLKLAPAP